MLILLDRGYFKRQDIPWHFALAESYTVADAYHVCSSSLPVDCQATDNSYRLLSPRTQIQIGGSGRFVIPLPPGDILSTNCFTSNFASFSNACL